MRAPDNQKHRPRGEYWREIVLQQEQSGLTVHAFCEQRGVTEASFYGWRKQLRGGVRVGFALVESKGSSLKSKAPVEVVLATPLKVQISPRTDAAILFMVLGVGW